MNLSKPEHWLTLTLPGMGLGGFRVLNVPFGSPALLQWAVH